MRSRWRGWLPGCASASAPSVATVTPHFDIRPAEPGDADVVLGVIRAAFGAVAPAEGDQVADLWAEVRAGEHLLAELVAVVDGQVVGQVGVSHCWIDARRELASACMLSPLSTSPEHQGRGIGTALVAAAIEAARGLDRPALFLEGSPAYYGSRGFEPASAYGFEAPTAACRHRRSRSCCSGSSPRG
jgi:putative acetyltransferase